MTHAIHDFTAKLRQPSLLPRVEAYVAWRRALARARTAGEPEPPPPEHAPISINLDLTTACNYRCDHCIDWDVLNGKQRFADASLRASLSEMRERGLRSVILIGGGEPTLYPGFVAFVEFLKSLDLAVAIVSNGSRGDRLLEAVRVLEADDWIRLSLDAGSNELFRAMHRPVTPDLDLDAICAWIPRLKAASAAPRVGFSFVITWLGAARDDVPLLENVHEIVPATLRARDAGFDYIGFKPVLERAGDGAEVLAPDKARDLADVLARIRAAVDEAKALARPGFDVYESVNLRVLEEGRWREFTHQPHTCHVQALRQVLSPLGLYNCPAHRGVEKARLGGPDAYADGAGCRATAAKVADSLERFDAQRECAEVTCLYHDVNWWLEEAIASGRALEPGAETGDAFL